MDRQRQVNVKNVINLASDPTRTSVWSCTSCTERRIVSVDCSSPCPSTGARLCLCKMLVRTWKCTLSMESVSLSRVCVQEDLHGAGLGTECR